jgi:hypothetical protein
MAESSSSPELEGVASRHSLSQIQNNGPIELPRPGARKTQSTAETRATGRYSIATRYAYVPVAQVQGRPCKTNAGL